MVVILMLWAALSVGNNNECTAQFRYCRANAKTEAEQRACRDAYIVCQRNVGDE